MSDQLTSLSRWLFLATLLSAPWAYGCTRMWTIHVLNALLAVCLVVRLLALLVERRWPALPWSCVAISGLLLAQGWFMVGNAHGFYDPEFHQFIPIQAWWEQGPGAIDRAASAQMMVRFSALLGALCFTIDLAQEEVWRSRLAWMILAAGASLIAFGLIERILGAPMIFWEEGREARTFFATFVYHGNAGSFINLVLPVIAVLTMNSFRHSGRYLQRAFCVPALLVTIAGAFVNVSKAAQMISLGLLLALLLWQAPQIVRAWSEGARTRVLTGAGAIVLALTLLVAMGGWQMTRDRWVQLPHLLQDNPRTAAAQIARRVTHDSRWWGFGPGTFESAFPHYSNSFGEKIQGVWRYAHQDYLQTAIEWGWLGAAGWAFLLFGGLAGAACSYFSGREVLDWPTRSLYLAATLSLGATALHSMVDFPFQIASLQLYVFTYAGIGWSALFTRRTASSRHRRLRSHKLPQSSSGNNARRPPSADD